MKTSGEKGFRQSELPKGFFSVWQKLTQKQHSEVPHTVKRVNRKRHLGPINIKPLKVIYSKTNQKRLGITEKKKKESV